MILKKKILVFHSPSRQATSRPTMFIATDLRSGTGFNGPFLQGGRALGERVPFSRRSTLWTIQQWYSPPRHAVDICPARRSEHHHSGRHEAFRVIETIALHQRITYSTGNARSFWQLGEITALIPTMDNKGGKMPRSAKLRAYRCTVAAGC